MNLWLIFILVVIIGHFLLDVLTARLTLKALSPEVPEPFADTVDADTYRRSQRYTREKTRFGLLQQSLLTPVTVLFLLGGGFNLVDRFARSFGGGEIVTGLIFIGCLLLLSLLLSLPFTMYATFSIEARFGFNRTTPRTFVTDLCKMLLLAGVIGGPVLALILWFFAAFGSYAWLYCWLGVVVVGFILQFLAPVLIMPLFNRFTPLADGSLKTRIEDYAAQQQFAISGIFTMDGSRRSTKLNAFFTGFGRFRKIVFFDTLLEKLNDDEIIAVLAHELGHFKQRHLLKMLVISIMQTGLMFFLLSFILGNESLFAAFAMEDVSIYGALVFFAFLYAPLNTILAIAVNALSRRHEYAADRFAAQTTRQPGSLINALKKLSRENLSNLTPHPLAVFLSYSHPPVRQRIAALERESTK